MIIEVAFLGELSSFKNYEIVIELIKILEPGLSYAHFKRIFNAADYS